MSKSINLTDIKQIISQKRNELNRLYAVRKIGVFGSYASNSQTDLSDIDVLVEFSARVGFFKFIELEEYLSSILNKKIDLVTEKALKPYIKNSILKEVVYL